MDFFFRYWVLGCFNGTGGMASFFEINALQPGTPGPSVCSTGQDSNSLDFLVLDEMSVNNAVQAMKEKLTLKEESMQNGIRHLNADP